MAFVNKKEIIMVYININIAILLSALSCLTGFLYAVIFCKVEVKDVFTKYCKHKNKRDK